MQTPAAMPVTVLPLTVQTSGVVLLKLTASPEVAVAETVPVPPTTIVGPELKLTLWLALMMAPDQVPLKYARVHVPDSEPVESIVPEKTAPLETLPLVIDSEPFDDILPLAYKAPPLFLDVKVAVIDPVDEIVAFHVPLSPPE